MPRQRRFARDDVDSRYAPLKLRNLCLDSIVRIISFDTIQTCLDMSNIISKLGNFGLLKIVLNVNNIITDIISDLIFFDTVQAGLDFSNIISNVGSFDA